MARFFNPFTQFTDAAGNVLSGGKMFFFDSATEIERDTFSDTLLQNANDNPIILNAAGRLPGDVFLSPVFYRLRLTDSLDVQIDQTDSYNGATLVTGGLTTSGGISTVPVQGEAQLFGGTVGGATIRGSGSTNDITIQNKTGGLGTILTVPTGTQRLEHHGQVNFKAATELTIATGVITITKSYHSVDTEADAATDDLDTILGDVAGDLLILKSEDSARDITAKDGVGNLSLSGDFTFFTADDHLILIRDGANWFEIARSTPNGDLNVTGDITAIGALLGATGAINGANLGSGNATFGVLVDTDGLFYVRDTGGTGIKLTSVNSANSAFRPMEYEASAHTFTGGGIISETILPATTELFNLGSALLEWDNLFVQNAPTVSDERTKNDLGPIVNASEFLERLDPRIWSRKNKIVQEASAEVLDEDGIVVVSAKEEIITTHSRPHTGFMAQGVKQAMKDSGIDDWAGYAYHQDEDLHVLRLTEFIAYLVKGHQELSERIKVLEAN